MVKWVCVLDKLLESLLLLLVREIEQYHQQPLLNVMELLLTIAKHTMTGPHHMYRTTLLHFWDWNI